MAFNPADYPANWKAIRLHVLVRAGNKCEGSPDYPECRAQNGEPHPLTGSKVVLTIAHLDHGKNGNLDNLRALCQRCHLKHDLDYHQAKAAATRERKKATA